MKVMKPNIVMIETVHAMATATATLGLVRVRKARMSPTTDVMPMASTNTHMSADCTWPVGVLVEGARPRPYGSAS